jgi:uncharacterized protein YdiU (UPF0061 family)
MNKKFEEFNNILKKLYKNGNQKVLADLYNYYNSYKSYIHNDFLKDKNNILNIDDNEFNLSKLVIKSLESYKEIVVKYCNFIETLSFSTREKDKITLEKSFSNETFIPLNEEITENNMKKTIIDIICFLHMKDNIIDYITDIPEHNDFFFKSGLFLYDEKLILELYEKRINESLYKILVKNLVYYKIKYDLTYDL